MTDEKWIPIFRTGAHVDNNGNMKIWRQKDLDDIVDKYNPSYKEAPIVIGHPTDNAPAYGWVEAIKRYLN
ncbi:hypothetical protein HY745_07090 [Candidatus Desantisbacteria bacterium]|nr:hypothetical protein [Candidatus Desantisbacteria bacterium]